VPELIEVEQYRAFLDQLCGLVVESVEFPDRSFVRPKGVPNEVFDGLVGERFESTSRVGKLLLANFGPPHTYVVGMRFGMTGRLLIDGEGPIDVLEYSSSRNDPAWDRVVMNIGGHRVSIRDQRRLGSVELDPDLSVLGVDATQLTVGALVGLSKNRKKAIKSLLLDQTLVAGLGNLLVDEILWHAGIDPLRAAGELDETELAMLASTIVTTVGVLSGRGGSHTGDSFALRHDGSACSACVGEMRHDTVGGRSTWWCATHQN